MAISSLWASWKVRAQTVEGPLAAEGLSRLVQRLGGAAEILQHASRSQPPRQARWFVSGRFSKVVPRTFSEML